MSFVTQQSGSAALLARAAVLVGQHLARGREAALGRILEEQGSDVSALGVWNALWQGAGLSGQCRSLHQPGPADLPFVAWHASVGWCLLQSRSGDGLWCGQTSGGASIALTLPIDAACIGLPRRAANGSRENHDTPGEAGPSGALALVGAAMLARKAVFIDAVLGSALVTVLALATSLFSMQVYDRVVPNQSFNTLWVLTVGASLSIGFEFMLKQVRGRSVDRACNAIDHELSTWFFKRMMGIRMEARPASVGTLAAQVKGFEMVRGVLASTSLFVLTDVPFALFFLLMIALMGGPLVAVPLVALPLALTAGLMFQSAIGRHARRNLSASNRKAGLLVEAVDGAESLKANGAEWTIQGRWEALVAETGFAEQGIRNHAALSQNLTALLQQLSYIALVAVGAWLVAENRMTMGALMACSIISNRALMPVVQLPGVMVQWAQARAAINGLDQIIALANEDDGATDALAPQGLAGALRFERIDFAYGGSARVALDVAALAIEAGERVGLVGAIGSGKSTLLKLASGMYRPARGKVFLGGVDLALLAPALVRELVGYLPQEARLFSGSLRDNLLLGLADPGDEAILAAARRTGLIELVLGQPRGLALQISEGGRGVSGGQKQLIAITRLLLARPRVWLLDEPTGAMDAVSEARIVALLGELAEEGITLIATTHKSALLPLMDRLVVMHGGRIVLDGGRDAVMAQLSGKAPRAQVAA